MRVCAVQILPECTKTTSSTLSTRIANNAAQAVASASIISYQLPPYNVDTTNTNTTSVSILVFTLVLAVPTVEPMWLEGQGKSYTGRARARLELGRDGAAGLTPSEIAL